MEFKFNINELFKQPIVEVNSNLIPHGFSGDRRALLNTVSKVAQVVDGIGEASAAAQGLTKPITSADRLRNSEHKLYLLIDQAGNDGKGVVTGMLKIGTKGLYVFDREGTNHQVKPACVLDFYVHESRQRNGLGKQLFEHMLQKEQHEPVKMAIDRPSEKFLGFLNKHYNLNSPIKQMNNYVVFDGFFPGGKKNGFSESNNNNNNNNSDSPGKKQYISSNSANGLQNVTTPYGRYGAPRPPCSMGQIIHNQSATVQNTQETTGARSEPAKNYQTSGQNSQSLANQMVSTSNQYYSPQNWQQPEQVCRNNFVYPYQEPPTQQYFPVRQIPNQFNNVQYSASAPIYPHYSYSAPPYSTNQEICSTALSNQQIYSPPPNNQQTYSTPQTDQQIYAVPTNNQQSYSAPQTFATPPNNQQTYLEPQNNQQTYATLQNNPQTHLAPQISQQTYAASLNNQQTYSAPQSNQQTHSTPQINQQSYSTPQNSQQTFTAVPNQQTYSAPQNNQQTFAALPNNEQTYSVPQNNQQIYSTPQINQQTYSTPPSNQQIYATSQNNQPTYLAPPNNNQQMFTIPQSNQQIYSSLPSNQQSFATPPSNLQIYSPTQTQMYSSNRQNEIQPQPVVPKIPPQHIVSAPVNVSTPQYQLHLAQSAPIPQNQQIQPNSQPQTHSFVNVSPQYQQSPIPVGYPHTSQKQLNTELPFQRDGIQDVEKMRPDISNEKNYMEEQRAASGDQNQIRQNQSQMLPLVQTNPIEPVKFLEKPAVIKQRVEMVKEGNNVVQDGGGDNAPPVEEIEDDDGLRYGYPPQLKVDIQVVVDEKVSASPKLERPRSLSIQLSEDQQQPVETKEDDDGISVTAEEEDVEKEIEKITLADVSQNLTEPEKTAATGGKKTPSHLTEQGFFDLKFYHNKLW